MRQSTRSVALLVLLICGSALQSQPAWSAMSDTDVCAIKVRVDEFFRNGKQSTPAKATSVRVFVLDARMVIEESRADCSFLKGTSLTVERSVLRSVSKGSTAYLTRRQRSVEFERNGTRTYGAVTTFTRMSAKAFEALPSN